jgi:Ca-activated chloride channel family protein
MRQWPSVFKVAAVALRPLLNKHLITLMLFALTLQRSPSAGFIIVDESHWQRPEIIPPPVIRPWPPEFTPPRRPHIFAPLEISSIEARAKIRDQVAATKIEEDFYNPNDAQLEGTFIFPVPKGAHIDRFTMEINGKAVDAELLPARKARAIYEEIVRKAKDPALLEYVGRDLLKARIFPIEPRSHKRISISYTQLLTADSGLVSYVLPLNSEKYSPKPAKRVDVKVDLETKRPLKSIYSPSHNVDVERDGESRAEVSFKGAEGDEDFSLFFAAEKDDLGVSLLTCRDGDGGYFLLLASPGVNVSEKAIVPKDVVFVLDTSGSMAGKKIVQARKALQFCINNLNENDRFEILRFSTEVEPLFDGLRKADASNISKAEEFVKDLRAAGGTAIDDSLKRALEMARSGDSEIHRPFVVVFLTDGCPTVGATDENEIVSAAKRRADGKARVFCFGIGTDVNTHLLDRIAEETRAATQYVLPEEDIEVKVSNFFSKIKDPVLANPEIHFSGGVRVSELYPSPLPDLFKGQQLVLVGKYSGSGSSAVTVEGEVNGRRRKFTLEASFGNEDGGSAFIPRLWATRRVGYLLDEIRLHGENKELRDEVTEIARKYGIVTPYTAYLIVEDESARNVPAAMRSFDNFDKDEGARHEAAASWNRFKEDRVGSGAIANAKSGTALRMASAPSAAVAGSAFEVNESLSVANGGQFATANPYAQTAPPQSGATRMAKYANQSRFVGGKNFFFNDGAWADSEVQSHPKAKPVRIEFGSPAYYDFVRKHPEAGEWLGLGVSVTFVWNGEVVEVFVAGHLEPSASKNGW